MPERCSAIWPTRWWRKPSRSQERAVLWFAGDFAQVSFYPDHDRQEDDEQKDPEQAGCNIHLHGRSGFVSHLLLQFLALFILRFIQLVVENGAISINDFAQDVDG